MPNVVYEMSVPALLRRTVLLLWGIGLCVELSPCFASTPSASSVTLAWNPSTSTNVVGYKIYYGLTSGIYNNTNFVAGSTNVAISGLVEGTTYYFAATALDSFGNESQFSNETSYSVPENSVPPNATLAVAPPASKGQFALTVNGVTGFTYVVQASTNLVNWISVQTNTAPFTFVDVNASQFSQRFYRSFYLQ